MKCHICGNKMEVKKGWESEKALVCHNCGEYYYFVGKIFCARTFTGRDIDTEKTYSLLKED